MGLTFETTISFISFKEAKMFFVLFIYLFILSETLISSEIEESLEIEEIIVKSTKSLSYIYQLGSSVNVISAEEIAKRGFTFVSEALQGVPGLSISQTGAFGGTTTLAIRGAPSSQTLVLIDGISVNDPSSPGGGYDFSNSDIFVSRFEFALIGLWMNINPPGAFNKAHMHPGSHYSGVFWVKLPKDSGSITFQNDSSFKCFNELLIYNSKFKEDTIIYQNYSLFPGEGAMVLFPSSLYHCVEENKSDEDRISISFNVELGGILPS